MKRWMEKIVFCGFVTAWRLATWPTSRSPSLVNATTEGVVRPPSELGMTTGSPPSITATTELVVPRSMPMIFCAIRRAPQSDVLDAESAQLVAEASRIPGIGAKMAVARYLLLLKDLRANTLDHVPVPGRESHLPRPRRHRGDHPGQRPGLGRGPGCGQLPRVAAFRLRAGRDPGGAPGDAAGRDPGRPGSGPHLPDRGPAGLVHGADQHVHARRLAAHH